MDRQVQITLTALNGDIFPSERILDLSRNRCVVPIGRASKSISKGLQGAGNNAWFDSPVMSRDHAEISFDANNHAVLIQDIGSMHGTFINDSQLPRQENRAINDGDVVVFGAEVRRGLETFPACAFRVNVTFSPYKAANTYAFPESSDVEDEEDYGFSDEDMKEDEQGSSSDDLSIESPPIKVAQSVDAIDLTGDDSPFVPSSNRIDLTGETSAEQSLMGLLGGRPSDINDDTDPINIAVYAGNDPKVIESDEDDGRFSSDSDDQSDVESDDSVSDAGCVMLMDDSDLDQGEEESESEDIADEDDPDDGEQPLDVGEQHLPSIDNMTRYAVATVDGRTVLLSDRNLQEPLAVPSDSVEDDDESDFGLLRAGADGIRAMFDEGLLHNNPDHPYVAQLIARERESKETPPVIDSPKHVAFAPSESASSSSFSSFSKFDEQAPSSLGGEGALSTPSPIVRQPSPSDAAMVKSAMKSNTRRTNHNDIYQMPPASFGKPTAQTLGELSNKVEFFTAREENKAKMQVESHIGEIRRLGNSSIASSIGRSGRLSRADCIAQPYQPSRPLTTATNVQNDFTPSIHVSSFLDKPDQGPIHNRLPSPEPDMTSAVKYNQSKASITAAANESTAQPQASRSVLRIDEIIETNPSSITPKTLKRKAESISNVVEEEVTIWGSAPPPSFGHDSTDIVVPKQEAFAPGMQSELLAVPSAKNVQASDQRPAKRMKKFMEKVGYAALGGVAVGAGLFGALVATAPDFL